MNGSPLNGGASSPLFTSLFFKDFDICWAGPNLFGPGFCFGTEDGRLLLTDEDGTPRAEPIVGSPSREAINGVARSGEWLAVSTRQEVTMFSVRSETMKKHGGGIMPHGAHGIAVTPGGYFVAPLGRSGVMLLKPGATASDPVGLLTPGKSAAYFYRVLAVPGEQGKDRLICATRRDGIGISEFQWGQGEYSMRVAGFDALDIIDVCAVEYGQRSQAVAALARDGSLILVNDPMHQEKSSKMKFRAVRGIAYRLLSRGGDLFVLTSQGLYGLMKLGERLVTGLPPEGFITQILTVPIEAVDANVAGRWLVVITPDDVKKIDLDMLPHMAPESLGDQEQSSPKPISPRWREPGVLQLSNLSPAV